MEKLAKVNWVICPECKFRYYVGTSLLLAKGVNAICPKCRAEFDANSNLEPAFNAAIATWT